MIQWNTDVNAPGCPGEIVNDDGRTVLVQTDWDYAGVANTFGWSTRQVQSCEHCGHDIVDNLAEDKWECEECGEWSKVCEHHGTDGTVLCPHCGVSAGEFIAAAGEWLRDNDGVTADDPGYFSE